MKYDSKIELSKRDQQRRSLVLEQSIWKTVFTICLPLALYQIMNQLFRVVDTMMAGHIDSMVVSTVTYLGQINSMVSALGAGLAIGSSLKISQAYGEGDFPMVKWRISSLYAMTILLGGTILLILIPLYRPFLQLMNTPDEIITMGQIYFKVEVCSMAVRFFNNAYIAVERVRGNTKRILYLNVEVIAIKLGLTAFFVYVLKGNMIMIAIATLLAESILMIHGIRATFFDHSIFSFDRKMIRWDKSVTMPMLTLSVPVISEKIVFSLGKVIVNSMSIVYGALMVGALGVSNLIAGVVTAPFNGIQEGGSAIISQNFGAGKEKRALDTFYKVLTINLCIGILGLIITKIIIYPMSQMYAAGDQQFALMIVNIYHYDMVGNVLLAINASVMTLLYGYGKTKIAMLINFARLFIFRVPVLWFLQNYTDVGERSVGLVMMISHIGVAMLSIAVGVYEVRGINKRILREGDSVSKH